MNLNTRIDRLEDAAGLARVIQITATDEADFRQKFEAVLLSTSPGPATLEIDIAGVKSREPYTFLTHEERLELLA